MKNSLIGLALVAACIGAQAQEATAQSQAGSASQAGAASQSGAIVNLHQTTTVPEVQKIDYHSTNKVENITSGGTRSEVVYSGDQKVRNVPGISMSGPASGPCTGVSGGLGIAGPGFGVGLNGSKVDDGCTVRENTRVLGQLFQALDSADAAKPQARAALLESMTILQEMNRAIGKDYVKPKPTPVATAPAAPTVAGSYTGTDPYIKARLGIK